MTLDAYEVDRKVTNLFKINPHLLKLLFSDITFLLQSSRSVVIFPSRGSASLSMWARQVSRLEMPAGSCSASSMVSVLMESRWKPQRNPTLVKTHSTHSLILVAQVDMFPGQYMLTWSPQWLVRAFIVFMWLKKKN